MDNLPGNFDGKLPVENLYGYTNLDKCSFKWQLMKFSSGAALKPGAVMISKGTATPLSLLPGQKGMLDLKLDNNFSKADALYLKAYDTAGKEIVTRSWAITGPKQIADKAAAQKTSAISTKDGGTIFTVTCDAVTYFFDKQTGFLQKVSNGKKDISLSEGPSLAGVKLSLTEFRTYEVGNKYIVEPVYDAANQFKVKWTFKKDGLPELDYEYTINKQADFLGITFTYPEEKIKGMQWLGRGPYHVWKNRLKGNQLNVWQKNYNNTITGESYNYPEFKGWHSELYWVTVQNKESDFTVYTKDENVFFQMLQPAKQIGIRNNNTLPAFPGNTIGFFNGISAIGTKFQAAEVMGPQSQKNASLNGKEQKGSLLFDFK
jgi:hypothetical protein